MKFTVTKIAEVLLIEPDVYRDKRGQFMEAFNVKKYEAILGKCVWVQDNFSLSLKGVVRGLHLQWPNPQGKLVSVSYGSVFDVAVDVRKGSPTFGKWVGEVLDGESCRQLWIPPGFAHGFQALTDGAVLNYKCSGNFWSPKTEQTVFYDDPAIGISWPIDVSLSIERDLNAPDLKDCVNLPRMDQF